MELRGDLALATMLLLYLLSVVVIAVVGGVLPALLGAVASFLLANWFLTQPLNTFKVSSRDSIIELLVFLLVALAVSITVDVAARRRVAAARGAMEAALLSRFTGAPVVEVSPEAVLEQVRAVSGLVTVAIVDRSQRPAEVVTQVGDPVDGQPAVQVPAGPGLELLGWGVTPAPADRRLIAALAQAAGRVVEGRRLSDEAALVRELAAIDRLRSALLAAVGHELRTPLAGAKAAVSSLRQPDIDWTAEEREGLLMTIEESTDRLTDLIANLLDLSRLQAGALSVQSEPVALDEVTARSLRDARHHHVQNQVSDALPLVLADAGLLERVLVNLVDNAQRVSPVGSTVQVTAEQVEEHCVALRVVDHGPGLPESAWDRLFVPFQRLDDRSTTTGLGLGLAIAQGFVEAMNGTIEPSTTRGGGLTMTVTLPVAT